MPTEISDMETKNASESRRRLSLLARRQSRAHVRADPAASHVSDASSSHERQSVQHQCHLAAAEGNAQTAEWGVKGHPLTRQNFLLDSSHDWPHLFYGRSQSLGHIHQSLGSAPS